MNSFFIPFSERNLFQKVVELLFANVPLMQVNFTMLHEMLDNFDFISEDLIAPHLAEVILRLNLK